MWGVDLGGSAAMSAIACAWETGRLETRAMFGSEPDLQARSLRDSVGDLYETARIVRRFDLSAVSVSPTFNSFSIKPRPASGAGPMPSFAIGGGLMSLKTR